MITTSIKLTGLTALRKSLGDYGLVLDAAAGPSLRPSPRMDSWRNLRAHAVSRIGRYRGVNRQSEPPRTCLNHALRRPVEPAQSGHCWQRHERTLRSVLLIYVTPAVSRR
jgi:hypothetical protein